MSNKVLSRILTYFKTTNTFDRSLRKLNVIKSDDEIFIAKIKIEEEHCNAKGTTHGGFLAMLMDTSAIISTCKEKWNYTPGFTICFDVKYTKTCQINDEIIVEAKPLRFTKNLAFVDIAVKPSTGNDMIAFGSVVLKAAQRTDKDVV